MGKDTSAQEVALQPRFFTFDSHREMNALEAFSSVDLNDGESAMLGRYQFVPIPGSVPTLQYYKSDFAQAKFMAIAKVPPFHIVVFIADSQGLMAFKKAYDFTAADPTMLASLLCPPPPAPADNITYIKQNNRALRGN